MCAEFGVTQVCVEIDKWDFEEGQKFFEPWVCLGQSDQQCRTFAGDELLHVANDRSCRIGIVHFGWGSVLEPISDEKANKI